MKSLKQKDFLLRKKHSAKELLILRSKFLLRNFLSKRINKRQFIINFFLSKKKKSTSKTQIIRRCVLTNRARVSNRIFGISRIKFRDLLMKGFFPGYRKAIW